MFDVSFDLTFINIGFSFTFLNNILSSSGSQIFVFLIFTFVNICRRKAINKMGGSILGGNFSVGIFQGEFHGWEYSWCIFLEPNTTFCKGIFGRKSSFFCWFFNTIIHFWLTLESFYWLPGKVFQSLHHWSY